MTGKCSNPECAAPINCHEGKANHLECEFWQKSNTAEKKTISKPISDKKSHLTWTGEALTIEDLVQITYRNTPIIIGVFGRNDAGKTTYLAMLFTLLLKGGKFKEFDFSGTKTINAWDQLHQKLQVQKNSIAFPDATPAEYLRLLHLALRNKSQKLRDVFLSDVAGEVFTLWSKNANDPNAENARWIYEHSTGFVLFIDCQDLIDRKAAAKSDIIDLAQMLKHGLKNRPVIVVWSKSDKKQDVHPITLAKLREELQEIFQSYKEIDISNFSFEDPDLKVHVNNILLLDWLLSKIFEVEKNEIFTENKKIANDIFLNYRN